MSVAKRLILIFSVLISCVACDQTTKSIAKSVLYQAETLSYLRGAVRLQLIYNQGGLLSLGSSLPETLRKSIFSVGVGFLLLGTLAYALFRKPRCPSEVFAIALVFSGGVANLFDRLAYNGSVLDFINIGIGPVRTGIFNVADVAVTVGGLILLSTAFRRNKQKEPKPGT